MSATGKKSEAAVDNFVRYVNEAGLEPKFPDDVPEELRTSEAAYGTFHWKIVPSANNPWVTDLVQRLPQVLPTPYLYLISRYRFCAFEVGPVMFFANSGHSIWNDLSTSVFRDKGLFPTLHKNGYLEFGKRSGGWYDPICFSMQHRSRVDAPIVQLDHEEILIRNRIRVVQEIAPCFMAFLDCVVSDNLPVH